MIRQEPCDKVCRILDDVLANRPTERDLLIVAVQKAFGALEGSKWIPCSERLPEEKDAGILKKLGTSKRSEYVLATVEVKGERMTVTACTYDGEWDWNMKYAFPDYKIIAWMPLPEPYREDKPWPTC